MRFVFDLKEDICVCLLKDQIQNISHGRTSLCYMCQKGGSYSIAVNDDPALYYFVLDLKEDICVSLVKDQIQNISLGRTSMLHVPISDHI